MTHQLIINLLLILVVAWILGGFFARFGLPVMLGLVLTYIISGNLAEEQCPSTTAA